MSKKSENLNTSQLSTLIKSIGNAIVDYRQVSVNACQRAVFGGVLSKAIPTTLSPN